LFFFRLEKSSSSSSLVHSIEFINQFIRIAGAFGNRRQVGNQEGVVVFLVFGKKRERERERSYVRNSTKRLSFRLPS
jgi:hypothetical protein